jgi:DNA-binding transcriptional LysR family regulator
MARLPVAGLEVFLAIAEHRSLRGAAAALGVRPPAVSYRLKALEDRLGVALVTRTTRSLRLTDAGRALLTRARPAMSELGEAMEEARGLGSARKGTLRITLPFVAYEIAIAPKLAAFQRQDPQIELEFSFDEAFVDIVAEGFHAGVRMGDQVHQDMIAVRLTPPLKVAYFASPAYLEAHGRPDRPQDLLRHNCIRYRYIGSRRVAEWQFQGAEDTISVHVKGSLVVDSTRAVVDAALAGIGIGWLFRPNVEEELRSGRLVSILDRFAIERPGFFLYYPRANSRLQILRIFVEFMKGRTSRTAGCDRASPPRPTSRTAGRPGGRPRPG